LIKIISKEENFKWHLEAFASELFVYTCMAFAVDIFLEDLGKGYLCFL